MFETLGELIRQRIPGLVAIYAFGSRARGDAARDSDFDVAVLGSRPLEPLFRWELQQELATTAGAKERREILADIAARGTVHG
jgi:predicted nucleotidyltransferase